MERRLPQRLFARGGDRCPVYFFELLISKHPLSWIKTGPLYLRPLEKFRQDVWYSSQPVGVNTMDTYMKKMATLGKLDSTNKEFTNHSVRKATVRKLQKAGVSNDKIAGHRNEQSLRDYANADPEDHKAISEILSNPRPLQNRTKAVASSTRTAAPLPSVPQYNFTDCTVYVGSSSSSMSCTRVNRTATPPKKKHRVIIESDSDED